MGKSRRFGRDPEAGHSFLKIHSADEDESQETAESARAKKREAAEADATDTADDHDSGESEQPPAGESGKPPLSHLIVEKIPLLVLVVISAAITYLVQQASGAMGMLGQQAPLGMRLGNALYSYGRYLVGSFLAQPLAPFTPIQIHISIDVLIFGLALAAISVAAVRLAKLRPFLLVGWCWFLGTLVPVIGLVQVGVQSMADRYTYIPLIGIFIIAAWGAAEFTEDWPARNKAIVAAVVLTVFGWCTWRQVATWSSSEALYKNAVEAQRYNLFALHGLGMVYWKEGNAGRGAATIRGHVEDSIRSEFSCERRSGARPSGLGAVTGRAASTARGIETTRRSDRRPPPTARAAAP